jgi:hypothetical protein
MAARHHGRARRRAVALAGLLIGRRVHVEAERRVRGWRLLLERRRLRDAILCEELRTSFLEPAGISRVTRGRCCLVEPRTSRNPDSLRTHPFSVISPSCVAGQRWSPTTLFHAHAPRVLAAARRASPAAQGRMPPLRPQWLMRERGGWLELRCGRMAAAAPDSWPGGCCDVGGQFRQPSRRSDKSQDAVCGARRSCCFLWCTPQPLSVMLVASCLSAVVAVSVLVAAVCRQSPGRPSRAPSPSPRPVSAVVVVVVVVVIVGARRRRRRRLFGRISSRLVQMFSSELAAAPLLTPFPA